MTEGVADDRGLSCGRAVGRVSRDGGQSGTEIVLAMAAVIGALALAIFVVVPAVRDGGSTSQRDAYISAVATQQARVYSAAVATQSAADGSAAENPAVAPAVSGEEPHASSDESVSGDRREAVMFVGLFGLGLLTLVGGSWFVLTRGA
jgi:hypothetical protein